MNRLGLALLTLGTALFVALLAWQGFGAVASVLSRAGWGVAIVAAFHLLPLTLDAAGIRSLVDRSRVDLPLSAVLTARWIGESVNSLLPAGQLGGPVVIVRELARLGLSMSEAAAVVTVNTTLMAFTQLLFAVAGLAAFAFVEHGVAESLRRPAAIALVLLAVMTGGFYRAQRRGMFGGAIRFVAKALRRDWSSLETRAEAIDAAIGDLYRRRRRLLATLGWCIAGWVAGVGEVWLALDFLGHPVSVVDALFLESAVQAIRGAAFAVPGTLGAQEGGIVLLAPLVGLPLDVALALSLVKRARELALGLPGLLYLHLSERRRLREPRVAAAES